MTGRLSRNPDCSAREQPTQHLGSCRPALGISSPRRFRSIEGGQGREPANTLCLGLYLPTLGILFNPPQVASNL
ncbi:hypothetical protein L484_026871 [Morus notabilis]|uniref:Uncharacterized protein n=1 Tax=Morus notabilis TaxID=981085 RepID=W9R685_9ROSA|nr:hypothetical protein L484_026871 [Morus notabilis]